MAGNLVPSQVSVIDPQSLLVSQGNRLRNVVLFEREDVRVMANDDVLTKSLSEIDRIKRKPGRFKTRLNFARDMTSGKVRSVLEMNFPLLQNRRYITMKDDHCLRWYSQLLFIFHTARICWKVLLAFTAKNGKKLAAVSLSNCSKCNLNTLKCYCGQKSILLFLCISKLCNWTTKWPKF